MNISKNKKLEKLLKNTGDMALKRRARSILLSLDPQDNDIILDVGCGDGYYIHLISNLSKAKVSGTDFDKSGLERARSKFGKKIPLFHGDLMRKLPFRAGSFNKVVMSEVTEHLPDDVKGLKEVRRVMKSDGILCLTVPCLNYPILWDPLNWILQRIHRPIRSGFFGGIWNQHERLYTKEHIEKVVSEAGFSVEESRTLTFWSLPFNHYIVNLVARMLASNSLNTETSKALSKYTKEPKRSLILNIAFWLANSLDRLNDIYQPKGIGVAVFIKARKV